MFLLLNTVHALLQEGNELFLEFTYSNTVHDIGKWFMNRSVTHEPNCLQGTVVIISVYKSIFFVY